MKPLHPRDLGTLNTMYIDSTCKDSQRQREEREGGREGERECKRKKKGRKERKETERRNAKSSFKEKWENLAMKQLQVTQVLNSCIPLL